MRVAPDFGMDSYRPVECSLHDRYEAAAVRGERVTLEWSEEGERRVGYGQIRDIRVEGGAEWLLFHDEARGAVTIRLDRVERLQGDSADLAP